MAVVDGPQPPGGCDRCERHDPLLGALRLALGLAEAGHHDATALAVALVVASLLLIRLVIEVWRDLGPADR